jgi:4-oxalocrotonate tautomerase
MPLVEVNLVEGAVTDEERSKLIAGITDATEAVLGQAVRQYTWVVVHDVKSGAWGMGGEGLTTDAVRHMRGVQA